MTDDWLKEIDAGKIVGSVLLDFSAAFDILDHRLLVNKLHCYGFDRGSVAWINSYLTNRKYCVDFNGGFSEMKGYELWSPTRELLRATFVFNFLQMIYL